MLSVSNNKSSLSAGTALALMIVLYILSEIWSPVPAWPAGLLSWAAAGLLISRLSKSQILQIGVLLCVGIAALVSGLGLGAEPQWLRLVDSNAGILSMLGAVSFLRLVTIQTGEPAEKSARGPKAFWQTMLAVALFGAFINVSAPLLIADKLSEKKKLDLFAAKSIIRAFCGGPTWSPFFAGMAVVLTFVADAKFPIIMACGLPFAILGLVLLIVGARLFHRGEVQSFQGYPITVANLWLPGVLVVCVFLGHMVLPEVSILAVIALSALAVTGISLFLSAGAKTAAKQLRLHVRTRLPQMVNELVLFLAAGVLVVGLQTLVQATEIGLPFAGGFDGVAATTLLAGIVVCSMFGLHPVISIAVATPLVLPVDPNPQLLAVTLAFSWSLGACANPLSGLNLMFQGRYDISSFKLALLNWPYVLVMFFVALILLHVFALIL